MSAFEFFFSFYGLLLGFSVAELVGGFARVLHERRAVRFGALTPLLALFVAIDIATFWNQAWVIFRNAPYNYALLILGLVVASTFYVAATLVFPRELKAGQTLDDHFWQHRRLVLLCVLAANLIMVSVFVLLAYRTGELATFGLGGVFWAGLALFSIGTVIAALARGRRVVMIVIALLVAYQAFNVGRASLVLFQGEGWSMRGAPAKAGS
jgi:hypothetical protein